LRVNGMDPQRPSSLGHSEATAHLIFD